MICDGGGCINLHRVFIEYHLLCDELCSSTKRRTDRRMGTAASTDGQSPEIPHSLNYFLSHIVNSYKYRLLFNPKLNHKACSYLIQQL